MGQSNTCNVMCFILVLLLVVINTSSGENFLNKLGKRMSNMGKGAGKVQKGGGGDITDQLMAKGLKITIFIIIMLVVYSIITVTTMQGGHKDGFLSWMTFGLQGQNRAMYYTFSNVKEPTRKDMGLGKNASEEGISPEEKLDRENYNNTAYQVGWPGFDENIDEDFWKGLLVSYVFTGVLFAFGVWMASIASKDISGILAARLAVLWVATPLWVGLLLVVAGLAEGVSAIGEKLGWSQLQPGKEMKWCWGPSYSVFCREYSENEEKCKSITKEDDCKDPCQWSEDDNKCSMDTSSNKYIPITTTNEAGDPKKCAGGNLLAKLNTCQVNSNLVSGFGHIMWLLGWAMETAQGYRDEQKEDYIERKKTVEEKLAEEERKARKCQAFKDAPSSARFAGNSFMGDTKDNPIPFNIDKSYKDTLTKAYSDFENITTLKDYLQFKKDYSLEIDPKYAKWDDNNKKEAEPCKGEKGPWLSDGWSFKKCGPKTNDGKCSTDGAKCDKLKQDKCVDPCKFEGGKCVTDTSKKTCSDKKANEEECLKNPVCKFTGTDYTKCNNMNNAPSVTKLRACAADQKCKISD